MSRDTVQLRTKHWSSNMSSNKDFNNPFERKAFEQWMNPDKPIMKELFKKLEKCAVKSITSMVQRYRYELISVGKYSLTTQPDEIINLEQLDSIMQKTMEGMKRIYAEEMDPNDLGKMVFQEIHAAATLNGHAIPEESIPKEIVVVYLT